MISASPFGMLAVNADAGPVVAMLPVVMSEDCTTLTGHVSVRNDIVDRLRAGPVAGPFVAQLSDAYVSASFYPSKAEHGRVVPTWNYQAVEIRGEVALIEDTDALRGVLEELTDHMEQDRSARWQVSDAPEEYINQQVRGIRGLKMTITSMKAIRKLSQNKSGEELNGVIAGLSGEARLASQAMAEDIRELREAE